MEHIDVSLVDWSRAQFALTAIYHWFFVPLTLGLSFLIAIFETLYVRSGDEEWLKITKFWMKLFGVNFAIGVATGIILEFEFGTNWSNYSWLVGDIFGAPLAIEGILAFFLESTFIAVMFFGWNKVSKNFHLTSSWLVAIGSNLSALWILVANGWMQNPVGMHFNPDTARNEMLSFWAVLFNPMAVHKFLHTVTSSYVVASLFVIGVSAWYLLKKREISFAKKSILVAAIFGLASALFTGLTGDSSAKTIAKSQPMKLAAMEGLYKGTHGAGLVVVGMINPSKEIDNNENPYLFHISIPNMLSIIANGKPDAFVPGISDLIHGNNSEGIIGIESRIENGKIAVSALRDYKTAKKENNSEKQQESLQLFNKHKSDLGYGFLENAKEAIPPIALVFYSFRVMVGLGFYFIALFTLILYLLYKNKIENKKWLLHLMLWSIPLGYLSSQLGWLVAEVGRQPWTIQDVLTTNFSTSQISSGMVQTTFFMFFALFTLLLIAEIRILIRQIKKGPEGGSNV